MVASVGALASAKTNETAMHPENRGDRGQRPDGAPWGQRLGVQHAEVLRRFVVLAHCVGNASARYSCSSGWCRSAPGTP